MKNRILLLVQQLRKHQQWHPLLPLQQKQRRTRNPVHYHHQRNNDIPNSSNKINHKQPKQQNQNPPRRPRRNTGASLLHRTARGADCTIPTLVPLEHTTDRNLLHTLHGNGADCACVLDSLLWLLFFRLMYTFPTVVSISSSSVWYLSPWRREWTETRDEWTCHGVGFWGDPGHIQITGRWLPTGRRRQKLHIHCAVTAASTVRVPYS